MTEALLDKITSCMLALDKDATLDAVRAVAETGGLDAERGVDALTDALGEVGRLFQEGEWFLGELVYAGEIAKEAMSTLTPHLPSQTGEGLGTIVVGTVLGDMHDLGKNIFITYATSTGFDVVDLGTDVAPERFVDAVEQHRPLALGLSCLLTVSAGGINRVVEALARRRLDDTPKIIVGGAAMTEEFARQSGADAFAPDAVTGADIIRTWSHS